MKWLKAIIEFFSAEINVFEQTKIPENVNEVLSNWDNSDVYESDKLEITPEDASVYDDPFNGRAVAIPIENFIDLHTFSPEETTEVLEAYLEAARDKGFKKVRIIHGRGQGVQRNIVQSFLSRHYAVTGFHDARACEGGWGATIAYLV